LQSPLPALAELNAIKSTWKRDFQVLERLWHIQALFMTTRLEAPIPLMVSDREMVERVKMMGLGLSESAHHLL
jgi:3-dehydroquinate synthase class II